MSIVIFAIWMRKLWQFKIYRKNYHKNSRIIYYLKSTINSKIIYNESWIVSVFLQFSKFNIFSNVYSVTDKNFLLVIIS